MGSPSESALAEFLALAARIERLLMAAPGRTGLDSERLAGWKAANAERGWEVLRRRSLYQAQLMIISDAVLADWLQHARETLTADPPDGAPPAASGPAAGPATG
ncbi:MAG TPA: hypothetical protein VGN54_05525 [Mycobacteriales bacterium]|nr:hypothetical protein [Mycobacteriales bacterium]